MGLPLSPSNPRITTPANIIPKRAGTQEIAPFAARGRTAVSTVVPWHQGGMLHSTRLYSRQTLHRLIPSQPAVTAKASAAG